MTLLTASIQKITDPAALAREWAGLEKQVNCSYFQTWGWIGTWLEQLVSTMSPSVVRVFNGDSLVGLGIFVERATIWHRIFRSKAAYLNEYPFARRNMAIEYNGLLVLEKHRAEAYTATIKCLFQSNPCVDEIFFSAVNEKVRNDLARARGEKDAQNFSTRILDQSTVRLLDLQKIESGVDGVLNSVSRNRRAQLKKSTRLYERDGPLQLTEASTVEEALSFLDNLKHLHTKRWNRVGRKGVFANPYWERFHKALIRSRFASGEIQLLEVKAGNRAIGYLYNFLWRGQVVVLQTGFAISQNKKLMPGYITHVLAIQFNKAKGMFFYNLLHGDATYKKVLCDTKHTLYWIVAQRSRYHLRARSGLASLFRRARAAILPRHSENGRHT